MLADPSLPDGVGIMGRARGRAAVKGARCRRCRGGKVPPVVECACTCIGLVDPLNPRLSCLINQSSPFPPFSFPELSSPKSSGRGPTRQRRLYLEAYPFSSRILRPEIQIPVSE